MRHFSISAIAAALTLALTQLVSAAPPPVYNWTGWYVGLNAGGGWGNYKIDNDVSEPFCTALPLAFCSAFVGTIPGQFSTDPSGFIGGAQAGYNYQFAPNWVAGIETDFQGANIKGSDSFANFVVLTGFTPNPFSLAGSGSQKLDWFGTLRGRLGWAPISPLLIYATGGLAYGHVQTSASFSGWAIRGTNLAAPATTASESSTLAGWTVGGGLEWMFAPHWSIKAEYLYYDLGNVTLNQTQNLSPGGGAPIAALAIQSVAHYNGNIARAGINYKF